MIALGDPPQALTRPRWIELNLMDDRPPGWYRDPDNARRHRYWDGQRWTVTHTDDADPAEEHEVD